MKADWSDLSNPIIAEDTCSDPQRIPEEITKYWKALFKEKPVDETAKETCLQALRDGNKVLPPTAQKCDAHISAAEIEATSPPNGEKPGP